MCDDEYEPVSNSFKRTLELWRGVEFEKFCKLQCELNICGLKEESIPETELQTTTQSSFVHNYYSRNMKKRQSNCDSININDSSITNSNFISCN